MNLTEEQKSIIKSKLARFENIQEGLGLFIQRKHAGQERIDLDSIMQTILDQNHQMNNLKDVFVTALGIKELDPVRATYLSKFYQP